MANVYNEEFQGAPCNKEWYDYLTSLNTHRDLECSIHFSTLKTLKTATYNGLFPDAIATNLFCKNTTTYVSVNTAMLNNYSLPVHELINMTATDEIDPRCSETKIPSATFSLKVAGVSKTTPLSSLETILTKLKSKVVRIYRGFCSHTGSVFDDNGRAKLDYYSGYKHDLVCLGNYIITEGTFNYETLAFDFKAENIFFNLMARGNNTYRPVSPSNTLYDSIQAYQRYPYPFKSEAISAAPDYFQITQWKLGYNGLECLRSANTASGYGAATLGLYGYNVRAAEPIGSNLSYGVNTDHMYSQIWMTNISTEPARWTYRANADLLQLASNTSPTTYNITNPWYMSDLPNNYKSESAITTLNTFNLFNNLRFLPTRPLMTGPVHEEDVANRGTITDGTWISIGGTKPAPDKIFYDKANPTFARPTNGMYFSYLSTPYKVLPSMLVNSTVEKEDIIWDKVNYMKSHYVDLLTVTQNVSLTVLTAPISSTWSSSIDTEKGSPYPTNRNTGFQISGTLPIPEEENVWFSPVDWWVGTRVQADFAEGFGRNLPARDIMGGINALIRGDFVNLFRVLWSNSLSSKLYNVQPLTIKLLKRTATEFIYNESGAVINDDTVSNENMLDTSHAYPYLIGLPKRTLGRVNNGDTGVGALFQLKWTMLDDPSLRVGTSVMVPLQDKYVRAYITKQERSFDGGARLVCTGWAYEITTDPIYDPKILNAKAVYHVNNPNTDPKGEWMTFTWDVAGDYSPIDPVGYTIKYVEKSGAWSHDVGKTTILFGDKGTYQINLPYVSQQTGFPIKALTDGTGYYFISARFPNMSIDVGMVAPQTNVPWNNEAFSQLHVGYIRASNNNQPLIVGKPLQG